MSIKFAAILAAIIFYTFGVWKVHDWYDDKKQVKLVDTILDNRLQAEKDNNMQATAGIAIQNKDNEKAKTLNTATEKDIENNKTGYNCIVPVSGVRIRNKAVTTSANRP